MSKKTTLSATKLVSLAYSSVFTNLMQVIRISLGWFLLYFVLLLVMAPLLGMFSPMIGVTLAGVILVSASAISMAAIASSWHQFLLGKREKNKGRPDEKKRGVRFGLNGNIYAYIWATLKLMIAVNLPILLLVVFNDVAFWLNIAGYEAMESPVIFTAGYLVFSMLWYVVILARYGLVLPATAVKADEEKAMTFSMAAKMSASGRIPLLLTLLVSLLPAFVLTSTVSPFAIQNMISKNKTSLNEVKSVRLVSVKQMPSRIWGVVNLFGMLMVFSYIYLLMTLLPLAVLSHAYQQLYDEGKLAE